MFIRMSTETTNLAKQVVGDSRMDFITEWTLSKKERETSNRKNSLQVRVTKAVLETGETGLLVSNLKVSRVPLKIRNRQIINR